MKILYVAAEALPFASTGGLADVMGALPAAVKASLPKRSEAAVIMPLYKQIKDKYSDRLEYMGFTYVNLSWRHNYCGFFKTDIKAIAIKHTVPEARVEASDISDGALAVFRRNEETL